MVVSSLRICRTQEKWPVAYLRPHAFRSLLVVTVEPSDATPIDVAISVKVLAHSAKPRSFEK